MTKHSTVLRSAALIAALALAGCGDMTPMASSSARFSAVLTGAAEVPPTSTGGAGTLDASLDRSSNVLRWTLTYSGLTGPASAAHFHGPAMAGANAGVAVPITSATSPSDGQATLTSAQLADLMAGKWYVNVHTAANPGGEIRGQVMAK